MWVFLVRPHSTAARRLLFQLHVWMGLLAGLYLTVVCVTGAALVFRIDMQRACARHGWPTSREATTSQPCWWTR
jgi:uncharacterized iron-regulated membrane protein